MNKEDFSSQIINELSEANNNIKTRIRRLERLKQESLLIQNEIHRMAVAVHNNQVTDSSLQYAKLLKTKSL